MEDEATQARMPVPPGLRLKNPSQLVRHDRVEYRGMRPAAGFWNTLKRLVGGAPLLIPREVTFCRYEVAETLLSAREGWRLAPEEGSNHRWGWVWLERDAPMDAP